MANNVSSSHLDVTVTPETKTKIMEALKKAMKKVGMQAESYAKAGCPVDTGLLRNSITFALSGETTHIRSYADNKGENAGSYEGTAPANGNGVTLYLGTNVYYAPYVELGHAQEVGRYVPAIGKRLKQPFVAGKEFLRPAMENHTTEYHQIIIDELNKIE